MSDRPSNQTHLDAGHRTEGLDEKPCPPCGGIPNRNAETCPECNGPQRKKLSKPALLLLTFFLGGIGAHKFYVGKNLLGVAYLLFCWTGIPGLIALIEFIIYAITSSERLQEKYTPSGSTAIVLVTSCAGLIVLIGIFTAIALPSLMANRNRAYISAVRSELENLMVAEQVYFFNHGRYANRLEDLDFVPSRSGLTIEIVSADENCFEAKGTYAGLKEPIWIDCNGAK